MAVDIWSYRVTVEDADLSDYHVEAVDGEIGKVARAVIDDADGRAVPFEPGRILVTEQREIIGNRQATFRDHAQRTERRFMVGDENRARGLREIQQLATGGGAGFRLEMANMDQCVVHGN